jgi:Glyoxalase superfamily protein/Clp amino terminal domain, pathogenicity island component
MRDYRDAKAMAHSLRAALATQGFKVTVSQSLELIAHAFGVTDWNTLAAAIRRERTPKTATPPRRPTASQTPAELSAELKSTLTRAVSYAHQRKHEYLTLEHLLLALTDDVNASGVMIACAVNLDSLRENLAGYIDNDLKTLVIDGGRRPTPTPALQRVVQRAILHAQGLGRETATGGTLLVAIFEEKESPAVWLLSEQGITQQVAANYILHDLARNAADNSG